ncbi:MAG TPA: flavodoxin domain-containing protein [Clostridiales bacterium]|nr:flavodoxin domain-containing protein [Clostridiales bacterium]
MRTLVFYSSKTGFVKKYAEWIAEVLNADLLTFEKADCRTIQSYDTVIYGGGLYAGGINVIGKIKRNLPKLESKKVIVFASGASPWSEKVLNEIRDKNFTPEQQKHLMFFYLRGGFDLTKLGFFDRFLIKLLKIKIMSKKKKGIQLDGDEIGMLNAMENPVDFTKKENIKELADHALKV